MFLDDDVAVAWASPSVRQVLLTHLAAAGRGICSHHFVAISYH